MDHIQQEIQAYVRCLKLNLPFWKPLLCWLLMLMFPMLPIFYTFLADIVPNLATSISFTQSTQVLFFTEVYICLCLTVEAQNWSTSLKLNSSLREEGICAPSWFLGTHSHFYLMSAKNKMQKFSGNRCQSSKLKISCGSVNRYL